MKNVFHFAFLSLILFLHCYSSSQFVAQLNEIGLKCMEETGVEADVVNNAMQEVFDASSVKYKNFLTCSYKKQGFQAENGTIIIKNMKTMLLQFYNTTELNGIDSCPNFNSTSHSQNAFDAQQCVIQELNKIPTV